MSVADGATPFYRSKLHLTALFSFLLGLVLGLGMGSGLGLAWIVWRVAGLVLLFWPFFWTARADSLNPKPDAIHPKDLEQFRELQSERSEHTP